MTNTAREDRTRRHTAEAEPSRNGPSAGVRLIVSRVLGVGLFAKILLANAAIVTVGMLVVAVLLESRSGAPVGSSAARVAPLILAGVLVSLAINALIVRLALNPLRELARTARRVGAGDLEARARYSRLADRDLKALTRVFNEMLERVALYRRRLRAVAARAIDAAEEERRRLAHELYDDTAQALAELLVRLRVARTGGAEQEQEAALEEVREALAAAIERLRRRASDLRPPSLDMLGVVPAIEWYARRVGGPTGVAVKVRAEPVAGLLAPEAELALYRILQEALDNVVRHSGARMAEVRVERREGSIVATVEDRGRGFESLDTESDGALGLLRMEERAAWVGGRVRTRSRPGMGTRVEIEVPVKEQEER